MNNEQIHKQHLNNYKNKLFSTRTIYNRDKLSKIEHNQNYWVVYPLSVRSLSTMIEMSLTRVHAKNFSKLSLPKHIKRKRTQSHSSASVHHNH